MGLAFFSFGAPAPAEAAEFDPNEIAFPVQGDNYYSDTFYACRGGPGCPRLHYATDIMTYGVKGVPVHAAADGVIDWIHNTVPTQCCAIWIDHGDGWRTAYIHLNNDTQNEDGSYTDDGLGYGIAPGLDSGSVVTKGQLIGWVGDSGNAEGTAPHLHFEIWDGDTRINPYPYLLIAEQKPLVYNGQFYDDDTSVFENDIEKIYAAGITKGCNPPENNKYCVSDPVSRGAMAAFIKRTLGLPNTSNDYFDDEGNIFENDINAITEAGIGFGCDADSFCPDVPLLREEFAEMFTRAFGYDNPDGTDFFTDDDDSQYEESINALKVADVTKGCNPPANDNFCPYLPVDRGAMAAFFVRALDL